MYVHRTEDETVALITLTISALEQLTGLLFTPVSYSNRLVFNYLSATKAAKFPEEILHSPHFTLTPV